MRKLVALRSLSLKTFGLAFCALSALFALGACTSEEGVTPRCVQDVDAKGNMHLVNGCNQPARWCAEADAEVGVLQKEITDRTDPEYFKRYSDIVTYKCCINEATGEALPGIVDVDGCLYGYGAVPYPAENGTGGTGGTGGAGGAGGDAS